ncbi:hypothetical protein [Amycolatopsis kentuckyensis]|uniref:hypothetical protein n=1 Tax=Amycolatopsis kentuckyensis TaxID=218823 RepID=UPI003563E9CB
MVIRLLLVVAGPGGSGGSWSGAAQQPAVRPRTRRSGSDAAPQRGLVFRRRREADNAAGAASPGEC